MFFLFFSLWASNDEFVPNVLWQSFEGAVNFDEKVLLAQEIVSLDLTRRRIILSNFIDEFTYESFNRLAVNILSLDPGRKSNVIKWFLDVLVCASSDDDFNRYGYAFFLADIILTLAPQESEVLKDFFFSKLKIEECQYLGPIRYLIEGLKRFYNWDDTKGIEVVGILLQRLEDELKTQTLSIDSITGLGIELLGWDLSSKVRVNKSVVGILMDFLKRESDCINGMILAQRILQIDRNRKRVVIDELLGILEKKSDDCDDNMICLAKHILHLDPNQKINVTSVFIRCLEIEDDYNRASHLIDQIIDSHLADKSCVKHVLEGRLQRPSCPLWVPLEIVRIDPSKSTVSSLVIYQQCNNNDVSYIKRKKVKKRPMVCSVN